MGTIRFLLALSVVVVHSGSARLFGVKLFDPVSAVQCFYIISGFLITMVLNERKEYRNLSNFYLSRFFRLWPTYIVVATASLILLNWDVMFVRLPEIATWPSIAFIWFSNLTLLFQDWFLFLRFNDGWLVPTTNFLDTPHRVYRFLLVPQCWSIGVELIFYLIAPFACRRWQSAATLFAFGFAIRAITAWFVPPADPWIHRFAPNEMMIFASGSLAYFACHDLCPRFPRLTRIASAVALAAVVTVAVAGPYLLPITGLWEGLVPVVLIHNGPTLLLMAVSVGPLFYGTRNSRFDQIAGELSYPMYVSHYTISRFMERMMPMPDDNALYVAIVIGVSFALLFGVTMPTDKLRARFGARNPASLALRIPTASQAITPNHIR
jgi:peptidoglycan/LPS O-acetylase OafA/YrhL